MINMNGVKQRYKSCGNAEYRFVFWREGRPRLVQGQYNSDTDRITLNLSALGYQHLYLPKEKNLKRIIRKILYVLSHEHLHRAFRQLYPMKILLPFPACLKVKGRTAYLPNVNEELMIDEVVAVQTTGMFREQRRRYYSF